MIDSLERSRFGSIIAWVVISCFALLVMATVSRVEPIAASQVDAQQMTLELLRLQAILDNDLPGLASLDDFGKAIVLRDYIHQNVKVEKGTAPDWSQPAQVYLDSTRGDLGHLCAGFGLLYQAALESQGIPSRYVGLFSSDQASYRSHASVEFWYEGQWYASDPTLNAMYSDHEGRYLSYAGLYILAQAGESYEVVNNGREVRKDLRWLAEDLPLLLSFMVVHPAEVWQAGEYYGYELTLLPRGWDGTIDERNVAVYQPPYTDLAVLR